MIERKCRKCGTWNKDEDYCNNCGAVISLKEEERIETEIKIQEEKNKPKDKIDLFVEKYKNHNNIIVKGIFYIFYSIYLVFAAIGAFLAWLTLLSQA
jgi:hypothetical protein